MENQDKKPCPYCKSEIDAAAIRCPHCQRDLRNWFAHHKVASGFLSLIATLIVLGFVGNVTKKPAEPIEYAKFHSQIYVRQILKAPSTAQFPSEVTLQRDIKDESLYGVVSYVDAENSFGAKVRSNWTVVLKYIGGDPSDFKSWQLHTFIFDDKLVYPTESQ